MHPEVRLHLLCLMGMEDPWTQKPIPRGPSDWEDRTYCYGFAVPSGADPTGFEPAVSGVTGRRVRPLHYGSPLRPHCLRRGKEDSIIERAVVSTGKIGFCVQG